MIKSMTAYGRASKATRWGRWVLEVHSVNRKMLDLSLYLPKDFLRFDIEIRKQVAAQIERGQVTLRLNVQADEGNDLLLQDQVTRLSHLKTQWEKIAQKVGYDAREAVDLKFLLQRMEESPAVDLEKDKEQIQKELETLTAQALDELQKMKSREGSELAQDMRTRLLYIKKRVDEASALKDEPLRKYRERITERVKDIYPEEKEAQERLNKEIALMAEKMDTTEEIVRLHSHIAQFLGHLESSSGAVGRLLDFLTQEMNREINTLGSKSADTQIASLVVSMKSELEKVREQVQNIE